MVVVNTLLFLDVQIQKLLNYNPDAVEDNLSCEYCPCDYKPNPNYDPKRNCEERCIPEFDFVGGCMDSSTLNYNPEVE